jgi:hypothetical protein
MVDIYFSSNNATLNAGTSFNSAVLTTNDARELNYSVVIEATESPPTHA